MPKKASGALLSLISLERDDPAPLFQQLDRQLRASILSGRLKAGTRLPATRVLATDLGVSRMTVTTAFDQLVAEGYLESRPGAGTYVAAELPADVAGIAGGRDGSSERDPTGPAASAFRPLSARGRLLATTRAGTRPETPAPFTPSVPAFDEFPIRTWSRLMARRLRSPSAELLGYGAPGGYPPLREAIASYLSDARGLRCEGEQVIIVSGAQQAFGLCGWMLLDPGDPVWVEDPGYVAGRDALRAAGAEVHGVPVDRDGLDIEWGQAHRPVPRLALVTPSRHHPLGMTMPLGRRLDLLRWAQEKGVWLLEDDYDSEFRYRDRPIAAIQGLDRHGCAIYAGTFSKVLFPSLRLGYIVVPADQVDAFCAGRTLMGRTVPTINQAVLADFIMEGHFSAHLRRMRQIYLQRQQALLEALRAVLGGILTVEPANAGMHLVAWLPPGVDERAAIEAARSQGVVAVGLSHYTLERALSPALLLGFTATPVEQIRPAVERLAAALTPLVRD